MAGPFVANDTARYRADAPHMLDHLEARGHVFERLGDLLAQLAQRAAATGTLGRGSDAQAAPAAGRSEKPGALAFHVVLRTSHVCTGGVFGLTKALFMN